MIYILGGGGHAKVIIDILRQQYSAETLTIVDDDADLQGKYVCGVRVGGKISELDTSFAESAIIAIGVNKIRKKIAEKFSNAHWLTLIHSTAVISPHAVIGSGSVIMANAVLQSSSRCGKHVIVNTAATIDHDDDISDFCHIAPGCHLAGNVKIGSETFVGIGTTVIPGIVVGANTVIGAGSCVIDNIPPNVTAVGTPARPIKAKVN